MTHARGLIAATSAVLSLVASPASHAQASAPAMTPAERHDWESGHRVSKMLGTDVRTKSGV